MTSSSFAIVFAQFPLHGANSVKGHFPILRIRFDLPREIAFGYDVAVDELFVCHTVFGAQQFIVFLVSRGGLVATSPKPTERSLNSTDVAPLSSSQANRANRMIESVGQTRSSRFDSKSGE